MIDYARAEEIRREERSGPHRRMPWTDHATSGASGVLRVALDHRFDIPALRGLRKAIADAGDVTRVDLDFACVRWLDAAAVRLLADDLAGIETRGVRVTVRRLAGEMAARLPRHPLRRFTSESDELFTDPDRDHPGFLPSDR